MIQMTIFPEAKLKHNDKSSIASKATKGKLIDIRAKDTFLNLITKFTWSPMVFKDNYRNSKNFVKTFFMVFDIDDSLPLKEAIERINLLGYTCIIGTSINHQKEKDGVIADRYRVIFPLQSPVMSPDTYRATWLSLAGSEDTPLYSADQSCKDLARYFFPCQKVAFMQGYRKLEPIKYAVEKKEKEKKKYVEGKPKGKLSSRTTKFLEEGAAPGGRHHEFVLAVLDMKAQGWTKEEVKDKLIPYMKEIKPEEKTEFQINYLYDKYKVEFEYRERSE